MDTLVIHIIGTLMIAVVLGAFTVYHLVKVCRRVGEEYNRMRLDSEMAGRMEQFVDRQR